MNTLFRREDFTKKKYDIIILLIGQLNAEGHGIGEVEEDYEPSESLMQLFSYVNAGYSPLS